MLSISIRNSENTIKASAEGNDGVNFVWEGLYVEGDEIVMHVDETERFYVIRIDDTMDEALVYVTKSDIVYQVPFDEKKWSYNQKSFGGQWHYLTIRRAREYEVYGYRNLAKNVMDQHGDPGYSRMRMPMWKREENPFLRQEMQLTECLQMNPTDIGRMNHGASTGRTMRK